MTGDAASDSINVNALTLTALQSNCYILSDGAGNCVIVDPGGEPDRILAELDRLLLKPSLILNTHGHVDHVGANAALRKATQAPILIHRIDAFMLTNEMLCGAVWTGLMPYEAHEADRLLEDGEIVECGTMRFEVMLVPGHSPGSVLYYDANAELLIGGDLVFFDSIGRFDLPGGSAESLIRSVTCRFLSLPDATRVLPGHGPETTVGRERRMNPAVRELKEAAKQLGFV
jgi:glyoxylase-like metal-dependent hydrolase (beta-lactamase superfamily II)